MRCRSCNEDNLETHRYCSNCGSPLERLCVDCGASNTWQAPRCVACGARLTSGSGEIRTDLSGERKRVSVLFADLVGSLALLSEDPEEAGALLEDVLEQMEQAVRSCGGTVTSAMGDGIMAVFGAPTAFEDHARRACRAALTIQDAIGEYARRQAVELAIRAGICTGEVIFGQRGDGVALQHTALGRTTHLASRLERMAPAGSILISGETQRLVSDWAETRSLGTVAIRGFTEPVEIFELLDLRTTRKRSNSGRALAPLLGRDRELGFLGHIASGVEGGRGQAVLVVGEPGVGKSRLVREFIRRQARAGWRSVAVQGFSHLSPPPFSAVVDVLRNLLPPGARWTAEPGAGAAWGELLRGTAGVEAHRRALEALAGAEDDAWREIPVGQRTIRVRQALAAVLEAESRRQPLIVAVDDLQWIDADSREIIERLVDSLSRCKVLIAAAARPPPQPRWFQSANCFQLPLDNLRPDQAERLVDSLLGPHDSLDELRRRLLARTGGNPFFIEETVRELAARGAIGGRQGDFRVVEPFHDVKVPARVQDVIAMRIDRLQPRDKRTLQAAAACGHEVDATLLGNLLGVDEDELLDRVRRLVALKFLEEKAPPGRRFSFGHALIHDVAYDSLLKKERTQLHARILHLMEAAGPATHDGYDALAFHAVRAQDWERAVRHLRAAGERALSRSACQRAVDCFEQALGVLPRLPDRAPAKAAEIDVRLKLRNALVPLGRHREILPHLEAALALASDPDDRRVSAQIRCYIAHACWLLGRWEDATAAGQPALSTAQELEDTGLEITTRFILGLAAYSKGHLAEAIAHLGASTQTLTGEREGDRLGFFSLPAVVTRGWLAWCLAESGEFPAALDHARESFRIATRYGRPFDRVQAALALGGTHLMRGQAADALPLLEDALRECREAGVPILVPRVASALGYARALAGRLDEARAVAEIALKETERMDLAAMRALCLRWACKTALLSGRVDDALTISRTLLTECRSSGQAGHEAWALYLFGWAHALKGDGAEAEKKLLDAGRIAERLGMRPLHAECQRHLEALRARGGGSGPAGEAMAAAGLDRARPVEPLGRSTEGDAGSGASSPGIAGA